MAESATGIILQSAADRPGLRRRLPIGAEAQLEGGVHFRVWAPDRNNVAVVLLTPDAPEKRSTLTAEGNGYFSGFVDAAAANQLYRFALDDEEQLFPDPASRFQPEGPHGPSQVIDPTAFEWTDSGWGGVAAEGLVLYEMHIGTFTGKGSWEVAARQLPALAELGVTAVEVMPVADFPGRFGWGYDGVNLFAPTRLYGRPDDFRLFVDAAHRAGIGVILDVVYNHLGLDGNYLSRFARDYESSRHTTDWGPSFNFDGEHSGPVREFVLANVASWFEEYHIDGLRLDATQNIYDDSARHIIADIVACARRAAGEKSIYIVGENEPQDVQLLRPQDRGGFGLDALWNDDFHHTSMVLLSGRAEAYYTDYRGTPQEFISAIKWGFLYQGQWYAWQKQRRGTAALDQPPTSFVTFIQNHDQIANSCRGLRCHSFAAAGCYRALTALWLLSPQTPMLFQGQEFAASAPFFYFADHREELAKLVHEGRREFMRQFRSIARPDIEAKLPDPADPATFVKCKLDFSEREKHAEIHALHRDLLSLRRSDPVFRRQRDVRLDGAVLAAQAFVIRFFDHSARATNSTAGGALANAGDRLLVINFGADVHLNPAPEPLLAPPADRRWDILWSSEDFPYGGAGTAPLDTEENWRIPGHAAVVLSPQPEEQERPHGTGAEAVDA